MITLQTHENEKIPHGALVYNLREYAFGFEPTSYIETVPCIGDMSTSLALNTVQIEIGIETCRFCYTWGYCYLQEITHGILDPGPYIKGHVVVRSDRPFIPGVSVDLNKAGKWPVVYDSFTGWVCIGETTETTDAKSVEFATNQIAKIDTSGKLVSLWLHPVIQGK